MGFNDSVRTALIGEEIGGCRLLAPLGSGSMGYVFKAEHRTLAKIVAVKILPPDLRQSRELRERFAREARIGGSIEHPNVAPVYAVGEQGEYSYIIMQYLPGASLYRALSRQGIDPMLTVRIGEQTASALAAVHRRGFVHRDVKPENIMLTERGKAYLTDFGVAGEIGEAVPPGRGGSPPYMSPEQCRGEPLDGRSDLYALGVMLYQMLTGRRPFLGNTPQSLMLMHQQDDYPPVSALRPETPLQLEELVDCLLAKHPAQRPSRAEETVGVLQDIQEELRALKRRDSMSVQRKQGPRSGGDSGFYQLISDHDPEARQKLDDEVEDAELGLLSLEESIAEDEARRRESGAMAERARRDLAASRFNRAFERIERAIELRPDDANLYVTRANILRSRGEPERAEADYRKALELDPASQRALAALGAFLRTTGQLKEAETLLKRAIELHPANVEARIALGKIYERAKATGLARKQYQAVVEHARGDERGYVALAALHIGQGKHGVAKGLLGTARELNPTFAPTLFWLAAVFAREEKWDPALDMLEAAVKAGLRDRARLQELEEFKPLATHYRFRALLDMFGVGGAE